MATLPLPAQRATHGGVLGVRDDRRLPNRRGRRAAVRRAAVARGRTPRRGGDKRLGQPRCRPGSHRRHLSGHQGQDRARHGCPRSGAVSRTCRDGRAGRLRRFGPVRGPLARSRRGRARHQPAHARHDLRCRQPGLSERGWRLDALQLRLLRGPALPVLPPAGLLERAAQPQVVEQGQRRLAHPRDTRPRVGYRTLS